MTRSFSGTGIGTPGTSWLAGRTSVSSSSWSSMPRRISSLTGRSAGEKEGEKDRSARGGSGDVTVSINAPHPLQYFSPRKFIAPHVLQGCKPSAFFIIEYHLIRERVGTIALLTA